MSENKKQTNPNTQIQRHKSKHTNPNTQIQKSYSCEMFPILWFLFPVPNYINQKKIEEIEKITGTFIIFHNPQNEYNRPKPFYYIQGNYWSIQYAIRKIKFELWSIEEIKIPSRIPLWKALGLKYNSSEEQILIFLTTLCEPKTYIHSIINQKIFIIGENKKTTRENILEYIFIKLHDRELYWLQGLEDRDGGPIYNCKTDPEPKVGEYRWGSEQILWEESRTRIIYTNTL